MFVMTVINFFLSTLNTGARVASFIIYIRKTLILDIDVPLSEQPKLVIDALRNVSVVAIWSGYLPVSTKLLLSDSVCIHTRSEVFFSDLIVIWRAWAIFPDQKCVILIPFILWIVALGA